MFDEKAIDFGSFFESMKADENLCSTTFIEKKFCSALSECGKYPADFCSKSSACNVIIKSGDGLNNITKYKELKKLLCYFYSWLKDNYDIPDEILDVVKSIRMNDVTVENTISTLYFKNLESLVNYFSFANTSFGLNGEKSLMQIKCICILLWNGIDAEDMINIKKSDLNKSERSILIKGDQLYLGNLFACFENFAESTWYQSFPDGRVHRFVTSEYLFRSCKKERMSEGEIYGSIKRFNRTCVGNLPKRITSSSIKRNGLFFRILKKELLPFNLYDSKLLFYEETKAQYSVIDGYDTIYQKWKEYFYDNTI